MPMEFDVAELINMNILIGQKESAGERGYFDELLAPSFAMRRAKEGKVVDGVAFLEGVEKSPERSTRITSVSFLGENRATVTCIVTQEGKQFDNFRLFVRQSADSSWKLLAWANEPLTSEP